MATPQQHNDTDTCSHATLVGSIERLIDAHWSAEADTAAAFGLLRALGRSGILRECMPGTGFPAKLLLAERLAARSAGLAATALGHLNIPLWLLHHHGVSELCRHYLDASFNGDLIGCTAISEHGGGSDPLANTTTSLTTEDGELVLNSAGKLYVLNAPHADFAVVLCRSQNRRDFLGLTWVVVPLDHPGVRVVPTALSALQGASFGTIELDNCRLPPEHVLGQAERGFLHLIPAFVEERLTGSSVMLQVAKQSLDQCIDFVRGRTFEGLTLAHSQVVRHRIADLFAEHAVAKSYLDQACTLLAQGQPLSQRKVAGVKLIAGEAARRVVHGCAQLFGGRGFLREYPVALASLDVMAGQFFAGVPEIMRDIVARDLAPAAEPVFTAEHEKFRAQLRERLAAHMGGQLDVFEEHGISRGVFEGMAQAGVFKALVPVEHGGDGRDFWYSVVVAEELMLHRAVGVASSLMLQANTLCPILSRYGSAFIHQQFLAPLMQGGMIGSLAVTEPTGGSALMSAIQCEAVSDGDDWIINGEKKFITNGPIADVVAVLARTEPRPGPFSMTLILVPTNTAGFSVAGTLDKLGLRSSPVGWLRFENCRVPKTHTIGTRGKGYLQVSDTMREERLIIAIGAIALADTCLRDTAARLKARRGNSPALYEHQGVRQELGQLSAELDAARAFGYAAAADVAAGRGTMVNSSMAKYHLCELAQRVIMRCVEWHGSSGLVAGTWMERAFRDSRVLSVYAGSSETMRELVGRRLLPHALSVVNSKA